MQDSCCIDPRRRPTKKRFFQQAYEVNSDIIIPNTRIKAWSTHPRFSSVISFGYNPNQPTVAIPSLLQNGNLRKALRWLQSQHSPPHRAALRQCIVENHRRRARAPEPKTGLHQNTVIAYCEIGDTLALDCREPMLHQVSAAHLFQ